MAADLRADAGAFSSDEAPRERQAIRRDGDDNHVMRQPRAVLLGWFQPIVDHQPPDVSEGEERISEFRN